MANNQTKPRQWLVQAEPIIIDANDNDLLAQELDECLMMLRRAGGAIHIQTDGGNLVIGAAREPIEELPGFYATTHFVFKWIPSMPAVHRVEPESFGETPAERNEMGAAPELEPVES